MGSIDIGPAYLGSGEMATAPAATRRDLRKVLLGARRLDVPLVIGSAGSAGAAPHLEATLGMIRDIARAERLSFRMGVLRADVDRASLKDAVRSGRVTGLDGMPTLTEAEIDAAAHIVGQMGSGPFRRALAADIDVLIAGRSCDTAIFAALPTMLGFATGLSVHMAKIVECASLCCVPGGREAILATLDDDGFELESMAPQRCATPISVAAHSLYEQGDPVPRCMNRRGCSIYRRRNTRRWTTDAHVLPEQPGVTARLLASNWKAHAVLASARCCWQARPIRASLHSIARSYPRSARWCANWCADSPEDYTLSFRVYGVDGVRMAPPRDEVSPGEVFVLGEVIAPTAARAAEVMRTTKQYLLHHGYRGRLSTAGNLAFPFTPPEVSTGPAYRFNVFHLLRTPEPDALFPLEVEAVRG